MGPKLAPKYRTSTCTVAGRQFELEELSFKPGSPGLELRAALNSHAFPNPSCQGGYGGPDLQSLVTDPEWIKGYEVVGAVNGTVFRALSRTYVSNQLLWSPSSGLIAPLRRGSGNHLFVADARGGRDVLLSFVKCTPSNIPCAHIKIPGKAPSKRPLTSQELIRELQSHFPTMTLALQSNMPLMDSKTDRKGRFTHWSECPEKKPGDWRCANSARTILCAKKDWTISLLTSPGAYPLDLARGLRRGGECKTNCEIFFNLDGGGSTQMAHLNSSQGTSREYGFSGRRIETTQEGCSPYRPVDNYLVVVRPR